VFSPLIKQTRKAAVNIALQYKNNDPTWGSYFKITAVSSNLRYETQFIFRGIFGLYDYNAALFRFFIDLRGNAGFEPLRQNQKLQL